MSLTSEFWRNMLAGGTIFVKLGSSCGIGREPVANRRGMSKLMLTTFFTFRVRTARRASCETGGGPRCPMNL